MKAITGWQIDTDIMHVIAPELRAANEQIDKVWKKLPRKFLVDLLGGEDKGFGAQVQQFAKAKQDIVSSHIHPTPQRLLLPREQGGLGNVNEVRYFCNMFVLLGDLAFRYGVSLNHLSQLVNGNNEAQMALTIEKIAAIFGSMSPKDCLAFE